MKPQKNVIGWTLIELVFLLAFFIFPSYLSMRESSQKKVIQLETNLDSATQEIRNLQEERTVLKSKIEDLEKKDKLKSKALPSCIEKGLSNRFLFRVKILGENRYLIDNEELTYREILRRYKSDIAFANQNGCVHSIRVETEKNLDASAYIRALKRIQMSFYTALR